MGQLKIFLTDTVAGACKNIAVAILILAVGLWLVKFLMKTLKKSKMLQKVDPAPRIYIENALGIALRGIVIISAAGYVGVPMASVAAVLGSAGLALGLALQGGLANIAGGMILLITRPFKIGDHVVIGSREGKVASIGIYYTEIITFDNQKIVIPNGTVTNSEVENFTANTTRRLNHEFTVAYGSDTDKVKSIIEKVAKGNEMVLSDPAPIVAMTKHGDSSVSFTLRVWVENDNYWTVYSQLLEEVKREFDLENVEIPYPQMDVHVKQ